nr:hypothetical protein [Bacteroidota bacterium]
MKKIQLIGFTMFLTTFLLLLINGCSSRMETPVMADDLTAVYPSKNVDDITAKISLCRDVTKKTGERIGEGMVFTIMEKESIHVIVDMENRFAYGNRDLMFHIDWIGPDNESFYRKRIDLPPDDSSFTISSSIAIDPDRRLPGEYTTRVYLFRELIAEKKFDILPEFQINPSMGEGIKAGITLYRKKSKKSGKLIGEGTEFIIKNKEKVRTIINLENRFIYDDQELIFHIDWTGPDGKSFYEKEIDLSPNDTSSTINSSISISPGNRQPGAYSLRLYLFRQLIAEKKFNLLPESRTAPAKSE